MGGWKLPNVLLSCVGALVGSAISCQCVISVVESGDRTCVVHSSTRFLHTPLWSFLSRPLSPLPLLLQAHGSERVEPLGAVGKAQAPSSVLMKLARTTPYYKRNRPHICSFWVKVRGRREE